MMYVARQCGLAHFHSLSVVNYPVAEREKPCKRFACGEPAHPLSGARLTSTHSANFASTRRQSDCFSRLFSEIFQKTSISFREANVTSGLIFPPQVTDFIDSHCLSLVSRDAGSFLIRAILA